MSAAEHKPTDVQTIRALRDVARALDVPCAHVVGGVYYFVVSETWALGIWPDDAGRFRLSACYGEIEVARLWATVEDPRRLADLAQDFKAEVQALRR